MEAVREPQYDLGTEFDLADEVACAVEQLRKAEAAQLALMEQIRPLQQAANECQEDQRVLRGRLFDALKLGGVEEVKGDTYTVSIEKSPPACDVVDESAISRAFLSIITKVDVNKKAIIAAWKATGVAPTGTNITQSEHVRVLDKPTEATP